jgi:hypothetical protein
VRAVTGSQESFTKVALVGFNDIPPVPSLKEVVLNCREGFYDKLEISWFDSSNFEMGYNLYLDGALDQSVWPLDSPTG